MNTSYSEFLSQKTQLGGHHGFEPVWMPDFLFDFQKHLTDWALMKGRAALFDEIEGAESEESEEAEKPATGARQIDLYEFLETGDTVSA